MARPPLCLGQPLWTSRNFRFLSNSTSLRFYPSSCSAGKRLRTSLFTPQRCGSSAAIPTPTIEEVKKAYAVLGIDSSTGSLEAIKKQYMELVKKHHPDIAENHCQNASSGNMGDINHAYQVLRQFVKDGGKLPEQQRDSSRDASASSYYYTYPEEEQESAWEDPNYAPFYEMVWSNMRERESEEEAAAAAAAFFFYGHEGKSAEEYWASQSMGNRRSAEYARTSTQQKAKKRGMKKPGGPDGSKGKSSASEANTASRDQANKAVWTESDRLAMQNMYEEGKSFEFIANALQRSASDVIDEYNNWKASLRGNWPWEAVRRGGRHSSEGPCPPFHREAMEQGFDHFSPPSGFENVYDLDEGEADDEWWPEEDEEMVEPRASRHSAPFREAYRKSASSSKGGEKGGYRGYSSNTGRFQHSNKNRDGKSHGNRYKERGHRRERGHHKRYQF